MKRHNPCSLAFSVPRVPALDMNFLSLDFVRRWLMHQNLCPAPGLNKGAFRLDNAAMHSRSLFRMLSWLAALLLIASAAWAGKEYAAPEFKKATAYPARD